MMTSINGSEMSVRDDDQSIMINQQHMFDYSMLFPKTENQAGEKIKQRRRRRRRKPKNMGGENNDSVHGKRRLTEHQGAQLELYFECEPKLETERKEKIAVELGLEPRQVAVWFQNRRARWKCKKLEDEYANLKASYNCVLGQNAQLEAQVSELNGRLVQAKCEILRMSGSYESMTPSNGNMPTPSSSSMSIDHVHTTATELLSQEFGAEEVQMLEDEYVRVMDFYWTNNMCDLI